ncbi:fumarylacetoacetate hydrolase family protein [Herbidospora sp. NBRC 101105]|uniref:2-keto-4-pentenoate hydratase n=1 Tax=Herbidospora sp. NBRC 101105 TaxID=3032195 RepID=UPI0024A25C22|nr:fumarylacetoacetate hydrolase family protein [Herbidospora sp. NBRC 101105]GLX97258.1 4-oxalocrotonate decarboxylase [Herbidospora sp. NBRC 101105]
MISELADRLDRAALTATAIPRLAAAAGLDPAGAYDVQRALVERRLARGDRLTGVKMGLTSRAKMAQVGVDEVIWGHLTDGMRIDDGGRVDLTRLIHPRAEPEIAFLVSHSAVEAVAPALEVIDSRFEGFDFSLPDVIADNTSAAGYVVGPWRPVPDGLDNLGVLLEVNGRVVQTGSTAAILGDPRRAFDAAVRLAGGRGVELREGWIVLAGAATAAVALKPGDHVRAVIEKLGTASFRAGS